MVRALLDCDVIGLRFPDGHQYSVPVLFTLAKTGAMDTSKKDFEYRFEQKSRRCAGMHKYQ